jgi:transcriptional regulator with GAF, ATPase, and Fis domain
MNTPMDDKTENSELKKRIRQLEDESRQRRRLESINRALLKISNAIHTAPNLDQLYADIHGTLSRVIDTTNFYIAQYDEAEDALTFPYCVDTVDKCYPPVIGISKTASLTAEVIRTGRPLMVNRDQMMALRETRGFSVPDCSPAEIWLGVPLWARTRIIGVMAAQSYTDADRYDQTDLEVMTLVADQVAQAIEYKRAEDERRRLIQELQSALDEIKTLQGILPVCSHCMKVRDDQGYWNQIDAYIQKHSDAKISHGICPQCAKELYPDLQLKAE